MARCLGCPVAAGDEGPLRPGLYRHFKGGLYRVLLVALDSETQEPKVVYTHLDDGSVWVRPLAMFVQTVPWPDGESRPRFEAVSGGSRAV